MRCSWAKNELAIAYHDTEWGRPVRDDRALFEAITLEGAQAGLSWDTVLKKRDRYREVFLNFDAKRVAAMDDSDVERLLADAGIIRHRGKIEATIGNAAAVLQIASDHGSFSNFVWTYVNDVPQRLPREQQQGVEVTPEAEALSKRLRAYGMRFVGPTIVYAFMQAVGMVNDHERDCEWST